MNTELIIAIIQVILRHGPKAVINIADLMKSKDQVTPEDVERLYIAKTPGEYFKPR